ncbi:MAG: alpha/beta hydrolase, partial [Rikenellaceae bacterium]
MVEKFIMASGVAIRMLDYGSGDKSILLLHGYLENANVWEDFAQALSSNYRVVAIDLPGHGISEVKGEVHTMEFLAEVAADVITSQGMGKAVVVGHSMGGYVASAMLENHSELMSGLVFFHSSPFADSEQKALDRDREIAVITAGRKDLIARMAPPMLYAPQNRRRYANDIEYAHDCIMLTEDEGI